jgi:hypothetical protein
MCQPIRFGITLLGLLWISPLLHAGQIIVPDDHSPITLQDTGKYFYFPESSKTMPDKYHHLYVDGAHHVCYQEEDPERDTEDQVVISIRDTSVDKEIIDWHCYEHK